MNLYVGNLPYSTTEEDLRTMFSEYGSLSRATVITDRDTGRSKGFGFVEIDNQAEAEEAIKKLDGSDIGGRTLRVNEARPRQPR